MGDALSVPFIVSWFLRKRWKRITIARRSVFAKTQYTKPPEHLCLLNKLSQLVLLNQSFICHLITSCITSITDINLLLLNPLATSTSVNNCYLKKHFNFLLNNCNDLISFKLFGKLFHIIAALTEKRL